MTVAGRIGVYTRGLQEGKTLNLGLGTVQLDRDYALQIANGTGAGQADRIFHGKRTIAASSNDDLDLAGVLVDTFGATITFARIKGIIIAAAAANTNNVVIGGGASNPFNTWVTGTTPAVVVRPGGVFALIAGQADATAYAVTAATADILRVSNSGAGTTVDYDLVLIGTSV